MELKAFDRWSTQGITVKDPGLQNYISVSPRIVPRSSGRHVGNKFYKSRVFIIERLMNKLMVTGHKSKKHFKTSYHFTGKGNTVYGLIEKVLTQIEQKTKKNPIEIVVAAVENAAPREEVISIEYGGARYPKALECAPQRRIDIALRHLTQFSFHKSFNTKRSIVDVLSEELIAAATMNQNSMALTKKLELERQADASR